ncbi:hypothetical protein [Cohnella fermenti]|uniref:hypothetical protein n=1 Tax=Cohnella fermenti TaxID=2565925 RepID=UPI001454CC90|nr:hypothetical protein [Cohnella fermenti]
MDGMNKLPTQWGHAAAKLMELREATESPSLPLITTEFYVKIHIRAARYRAL